MRTASYAKGMEGTVGAPPQRVCPKCARISWATGPHCPYCTARFSRGQGVTPWMLVGAAAAVLVGVAIMLLIFAHSLNSQLDDSVNQVTLDINKQFDEVEKQVQAAAAANGGTVAPIPTSTPFPTETVTPVPTDTVTPSPTDSPTSTPTTAGETPTPSPTIGP